MFELDTSEDGDPRHVLAGQRVPLDGSKPALRVCRYCGHTVGVLTGKSGPHAEGVRCEECHRHLGWLPSTPQADQDISLIE